ncbi:hypothetical protein K469DRAFT_606185, partial [Zopfia rhizophila CBS 207.26]
STPSKTRSNFAEELYQTYLSNQQSTENAFSSLHSMWFLIIQAVIKYTNTNLVTKDQWAGGLAVVILSNYIK